MDSTTSELVPPVVLNSLTASMTYDMQRDQSGRGKFIVVEGLDGSGKTSVTNNLVEKLRKDGHTVLHVFEPGSTDLGTDIRSIFLAKHDNIVPESEVGLLLVSKVQLLKEKILPALARGEIVICDRFNDTLYAYQNGGKGISRTMMDRMVNAFGCNIEPDLTLYIDISAETSMKRNKKRADDGGEANSLDLKGIEFRRKVRQTFLDRLPPSDQELRLALGFGAPIPQLKQRPYLRVDGEQTMHKVLQETVRLVRSYLGKM